jgi:GH25 family lysozyme M1 (1,4-beta-N-acetylmuramidase)
MALDYEPDGSSTMTIEQAEEFCRAVEIVTKKPTIIYTGSEMFPDAMALRFSCYGERPLWFPQFASSPNKAPTRWRLTMWQYTASGSVAGVAGDCDRDKFYGTPQALTALFVP